ncbi:chymotrypsinogen B, partial [Exaiptasia diaphana]|uniref:Uncharacterized protein n=1 Tax=Exaiptasia diaphana TaxID=2652724 RepID=A0A913YN58_EXADI
TAFECGRRPSGARIVGGEEAVPNSWPWQLSLRVYGRHNCGASLVDPYWAVTAGHCVKGNSNPHVYSVLAGAHFRYSGGIEYKISKVILHPNYHSNIMNDIALLKLSSPAALNQKVGLICLPRQGNRVPRGKMCWMTGWGRYSPNSNAGSDRLKQTFVPIADHQTCRRVNGGSVKENSMVCAGGKGTSVCNGESGGPLSCEENGRWVLRGAASWVTDRSCPRNTYSVYARVSEFIDWITRTIQANGGGGGGGSGGGIGSSCSDSNQHCPEWANAGHCRKSHVQTTCRKSCGKCSGGGGGGGCVDNNRDCNKWGYLCNTNDYVINNCKKTCGTC